MAQAAMIPSTKVLEAIDHLPVDEAVLIPLYEGYRAAGEALLGVFNRPRCRGRASDIIEDERERIDEIMIAIVSKLKQLKSVKAFWRTSLLCILADYEFFAGGDEKGVLKSLASAHALPTTKEKYSRCPPL